MQQRTILHIDINHCYAQIEEMKDPQLKKIPMAVGGHEESRHGIILTKNLLAKKYNIKTGESLREAYKKCPHLKIIHPNYEEYLYYSERVKDIYRQYSDRVESFGLDEAWVDITGSLKLFGSGQKIAMEIQRRVRLEVGLTVSIGLSFNKIFAKFGSDMFKPYGLAEITVDNFKEVIWPMPIGDLFYVGRATQRKLLDVHIDTIGKLAQTKQAYLRQLFGKMGDVLWLFANGEDCSEVLIASAKEEVKSIGNGITAVRNLITRDDIKMVFMVLAESVAMRLRKQQLQGNVIRIQLRNADLKSFSRQRKIATYTSSMETIVTVAMELVDANYDYQVPLRSINVTVAGVISASDTWQLTLFDRDSQYHQHRLDQAIDQIRDKYGFAALKRCAVIEDSKLTNFNPYDDHNIHPVSFF